MHATLALPSEAVQQQTTASSAMLGKLLRFNPEFNLHREGSPNRGDIERHIAGVFAKAYGAEVTGFAPYLMSMACAGNVSAAAGIRPADTGPLFLEQYLDDPVEQVLGHTYGRTIERQEIFELGNLVALRPGVCQLFYLIMAGVMSRTKLNTVIFAGTKQVVKGVSRLGFQIEPIVAADPSRLGDAAAKWGNYYDHEPQVMAIDLTRSMETLSGLSLPSVLLGVYDPEITELANHFNSAARHNLV